MSCAWTQWFINYERWDSVPVSCSSTGFYHYASSCESGWISHQRMGARMRRQLSFSHFYVFVNAEHAEKSCVAAVVFTAKMSILSKSSWRKVLLNIRGVFMSVKNYVYWPLSKKRALSLQTHHLDLIYLIHYKCWDFLQNTRTLIAKPKQF